MRARHSGVRARVLTSEVQPCKVRWRLARARTQAYGSGSPPPVAERSVVIARGHPPALDRERVGASIEPGAHLFGFLRRRRGQRRALTGVHVRSRAASRWGRRGWVGSTIHNEKKRAIVIFAVWGKTVYENWILRRRQRLRACGPPNSLLLAIGLHARTFSRTRHRNSSRTGML